MKAAVNVHVLMMRTLDLLRLADNVERGVMQKDEVRQLLLTKTGWLKVEGDKAEIKTG